MQKKIIILILVIVFTGCISSNDKKDVEAPKIILNGEKELILVLGEEYEELGAMVTDNVDKNLVVVIDSSSVDITKAGKYEVTYNVSDAAGNVADEVKRMVEVVEDTEAPKIILNGEKELILPLGEEYKELGATAEDDVDGKITGKIIIDTSSLDINKIGIYEITYSVSDTAGNEAEKVKRIVKIEDTNVGENLKFEEIKTCKKNSNFKIKIATQNFTEKIGGFDIIVKYDINYLEFESVNLLNEFSGEMKLTREPNVGEVQIVVAKKGDGLMINKDIFEVSFKTLDKIGSTKLEFFQAKIINDIGSRYLYGIEYNNNEVIEILN